MATMHFSFEHIKLSYSTILLSKDEFVKDDGVQKKAYS